MAILEVQHVSKSFGNTEVLKDISFSLEKGKVLSLIGSSGSGKTTLLRCLNFLEQPDGGVIRVNGETLLMRMIRGRSRRARSGRKGAFRPCISVIQPVPAVYGAAECNAGKGTAGKGKPDYKSRKKRSMTRSNRRRNVCWIRWGFQTGSIIILISSRAGSVSVWPSHGRWR